MEARVGIQIEDKQILCKINKSISLNENLKNICKQHGLAPSESYGLKFDYTSNGKKFDNYVTDENFHEVQDAVTLKLLESLDSVIDRIFKNMAYERSYTFEKLFSLSTDPGFIHALVKKKRDEDVLQWLADKYLSGKELGACLLTLLHLLKKQYIKELDPAIVTNIINCIKKGTPVVQDNPVQYALAVTCQMLYLRGREANKHMIFSELSTKDLIPFLCSSNNIGLQLNTLMLMNALVKSVKGEKRRQLIRQLDGSKYRGSIFNHIVKNKKIDNAMAHELYVYQTYILSLYSEAFNTYVDRNPASLLSELELQDNISHSSALIDFEESSRTRTYSTGSILEEDVRISFASVGSEKSGDTETTNYSQLESRISCLTYDCLVYYNKHHPKTFSQSRIEENAYEPGILATSERIIRIVGKLLDIGKHPTKSGTSYQPLAFEASSKLPFLFELFSRAMWLLSKTRNEMKAWTMDDYWKLMRVLEKKIVMVLEQKPVNYNSLIKKMEDISYEAVDKQWQKEQHTEWKQIYRNNPCVQELKQRYRFENEKLIFLRRMKTLQKGDLYPKLPEKKGKQQNFFVKLSDNKRMLFWGEWDEGSSNFRAKEPDRFNVCDIKHFIVGKACPHVRDHSVKNHERAFSVILEDETTINFFAKDEKTANLWIDGFNLLLGKKDRSSDYTEELETLQEMDCALQLIELQSIQLPTSPPEIPPLPAQLRPKPLLPPKSPHMFRRSKPPLSINAEKVVAHEDEDLNLNGNPTNNTN